jgi:hypothetical protein
MSGKSTLVAALVKRGATYYSDEYAVIDDRGRIHPYRKSLGLRREGETGRSFHFIRGSDNKRRGTPLAAGIIAVLRFRPGARWRPRTLTAGEAALALFGNTVLAQARARFALRSLSRVACRATAIEGVRPDVSLAAPALLEFASKAVACNKSVH